MTQSLISNLDLAESLNVHVERSYDKPPSAMLADFEKPTGYIDKGNLVSFVAGVSSQNQTDVLNSTLLAQLAADKKFNRETDVLNWYNSYQAVLSKIGWTLQGFDFKQHKSSQASFTVDEVILEVAGAAMTGAEVLAVTATLDALKKLSGDDGRLQLFNASSHSQSQGNFQVSVCREDTGAVAMRNMAFTFDTQGNVTNILLFHFSSSNTAFNSAVEVQTLNTSLYAQIRQQVIDKLGDNAKNFIVNLEI